MQLEWTAANPLQSHNHEQASELNPRTQPGELEACRLAQSGAIKEKKNHVKLSIQNKETQTRDAIIFFVVDR